MSVRLRAGTAGFACILLLSPWSTANAGDPPLPEGLEGEGTAAEEPALPQGLEAAAPSAPAPESAAAGGQARSASEGGDGAAAPGEPELPEGLEPGGAAAAADVGQPELPQGLESGDGESAASATGGAEPAEPALPEGLAASPGNAETVPDPEPGALSISGFWDNRLGTRTRDDPAQDQMSLGESRLQLRVDHVGDAVDLRLVTDFVYDAIAPDRSIDLHTGQGWLDLREANLLFRAHPRVDVKLGRQILTWGTGDLIFINDLFPKDWRSFFLGRDLEYLKAPSDAVRATLAGDRIGVDLIYSPRFNPDRFIDGTRVSFFDPVTLEVVGEDDPIDTSIPGRWFSDDEISVRLHTLLRGFELAAYGYDGFWKSPGGYDPRGDFWWFPRLRVLGFSVQGPLGPGIANLEAGYYDSRDDPRGDDPTVRNGELRLLAGYEMEVASEVTMGLQYYLERMSDYGAYRRTLPAGNPAVDEDRHVVTLKVDWLLLNQDLRLNAFGYFSPSDEDGYIRANANYRIDDNWSLEAGLNQFFGRRRHTFFGQFEDNSNVYVGVRYGFAGPG